MISAHYHPLKTKQWLRQLSEEDRKAFALIGFESCILAIDLFTVGGKARAQSAKRDKRGRFVSNNEEQSQADATQLKSA